MSPKSKTAREPERSDARPHQPGQSVFRSILSEEVDWQPFAAFPPSVRLAVIVGSPSQPGPYTIRVKAPHGVKLPPHKHPEDRIYTVISGIFYIGQGDVFDASRLEAFPPGAVVILPGNTPHFHWAKSSEYVTQITGSGHSGLSTSMPQMIREPRARNNRSVKPPAIQKLTPPLQTPAASDCSNCQKW